MGYESQQQYAKSIFDSHPEVQGELVTYDPRFYNRQTNLFKDWGQNRKQWKNIFSNWLQGFNEQTPEIKSNVTADVGYLKWLRDGGLAAQNAGLRARERTADEASKNLALDFASNDANFGRVMTGGTGSTSADYARRLASGRRIADEYLGRDVARERADRATENNVRLATLGRINPILESFNNRTLQPQQLSDAELHSMIADLNSLGAGTQFGAQPHFWDVSNTYDKIGGTFALLGNAYTAYATQGMGGPGKDQTAPTSTGSSGSSISAPVGSYVQQNPTGGYANYAGVNYSSVAPNYYQPSTTTNGYPNSVSYDSGYVSPQASNWLNYGVSY